CCLAFLAESAAFRRRVRLSGTRALLAGASLVVLVLASQVFAVKSSAYDMTVHPPLTALCFAALVWLCINYSQSPFGRLLNSRPLVGLGILSYSIYLWQQPFLNPHRGAWVCRWPVNVCLIALIAVASYLWIELPFLRLKERLRSGCA